MISITSSTANFNNISVGGTSINNFVFTVDKDAFENISPHPLTQNAVFALDIYIDGIYYSTETVNIQINESHLKKGENILTGTLSSGSSNQLKIKLYNIGLAEAVGTSDLLYATLTTNNPENITITTGTSTYNNIHEVNVQPNYTENNTFFEFTVDNQNYSNETFNLSATDKYGKTWTFNNFHLTKPVINSTTITHYGYETSIDLSWHITSNATIKGYNVYRSDASSGSYVKINDNIVPYSTYLDEGLEPLSCYYYKLTIIDANGNESDLVPSSGYLASTTFRMHMGWPVRPYPPVNIIGNGSKGSPNVYDVDGDNKKEIFFTTGSMQNPEGGVWAFKHDGTRWYMLDNQPESISGFIDLNCYTSSTPAIADIDNDGIAEIGITTHPIDASINSQKLLVYKTTIDNNNDNLPDKQFNNKSISGWENYKGPVFSDMDNNGNYEILVNNQQDNNYVGINIFKQNGDVHNGWFQYSQDDFGMCGFSMPVAFDFDNDNSKEIVIGCTKYNSRNAGIYIYKEDGTNFGQSNPVYLPQDPDFRCDAPPIIADIDNDGTFEILFIAAKNNIANIYAMKSDGTPITGWDWNDANHPNFTLSSSVGAGENYIYNGQSCPDFSVGDLDKDGDLEVICGDNGHLYIWSHNGGSTPLKDIIISDYTSRTEKVPIIADIDEDSSDLEIIVTNVFTVPNACTRIFAYKMDGTVAKGFPIIVNSVVENSPCVEDIDNNGMNELIVTTGMEFYVWDTYGNAENNVYGWKSYRRDNLNSGIFYKETCDYSDSPIHITSNQDWNKFKLINQDIIIHSSSILTISSEVRFASNAKIVVNPGGKLILDGCTLTNACDGELWQGIFIEGNPSDATQSENNQGVVELLNEATIENAVCAINVGLRRLGANPQMCESGGGIVKARNASFINNLQAVEFGPYRRHKIIGSVHLTRNASNFSHCNFIVNNQALFDLNEFEQHINLIDVEDIQFHSCHFTSLNNKGIAIQSLMSASFSLDDGNMLTSERSNISDFDIGILIQDGKPSYVYNTNFNNNFTGILTEKSDAIYIAGNHFQIPYESYHGPTCGVSLTNCPYFYIKNNIFHGEINCNYGLIINHSGKNDNIIKNNMFTHLRIANLAFGENSDGLNGIKGLQFHCNWFENNDQDIVVSDYDIETGSIRYIQGELGMGCGNIFTDNGFSLTSDNYSFQYHYKNNSHRENPFHVPLNIQTVANDDHLCNQIGLENPLIAPPEVPFNWQNTLYDYYNLISTSLENTKRSYQERGYYDIPIDWYMYFNEEVIPDELAHQVSLYYEITNLQSQLSGICQTALYCIYNDSLFNTSLYHDWLIRTHTPETDYLLAESYYENGNFNECFQIINAIPGSYEGYNEIENQNYLSYYNLKEYLRINEMTWSDLEEESAEKSQLFDIASSGINEAACVARAIVNSFFDVSYEPLIQPNFLIDLCMYIINLNNDSSLIPINDLFEEPKQNNYTTSIDQIPEKENSLTIYPNPASTLLTINNGNQIIREISLCDVLGKEIKTYTINASKTDLTISHLNKGFYFLRILTDKGMVNKSFVKE